MLGFLAPAAIALADSTDVSTNITSGFADVTAVLLVVIGAAFTLTALVVGAKAGIAWIGRIGKK